MWDKNSPVRKQRFTGHCSVNKFQYIWICNGQAFLGSLLFYFNTKMHKINQKNIHVLHKETCRKCTIVIARY